MRVGPPRDVSCCVDARGIRLQMMANNDPSVELQTCVVGKLQTRSNTDAYNHQIGLDRATFLQADGFFLDGSGFVFEVKDNAMGLS